MYTVTAPPTIPTVRTPPNPDDEQDMADNALPWSQEIGAASIAIGSVAANVYANALAAQEAAIDAINSPGTSATSATAVTIGTGSKTFAIQTGKSLSVGQFVVAAATADATAFVAGQITAHDSVTGSLTVLGIQTGGTGTYAAWTISLTAPFGAATAGNPDAGRLLNGDMSIAQDGTTFAAVGAGSYTLDGWRIAGGAGTITVTQSTDVPAGSGLTYSLRATVTAAQAVLGATELRAFNTRVEGFQVADLIGRTFCIPVWIKSSKTGTYCVSVRNSAFTGAYVGTMTVNAANTWEIKTVVVLGGLSASYAWDTGNGIGIDLVFTLASGSNFVGAAGWSASTAIATAAQVNALDTIGNVFAIAGADLYLGSTPPAAFQPRDYGLRLARARRQYRKVTVWVGPASAPTCMPIDMRAAPTITGGGSGFSATTTSADVLVCSQTTGAMQTLTLNARL